MDLAVRDAARLLSVSEKTIYRWIKQQAVPSYRINGCYRFNRIELVEWATSRRVGLSPDALVESVAEDGLPLPTLAEVLEAGGVYYRIEGKCVEQVLAGVVEHLRLPGEVDRGLLLRALIAREKISPTAVGDGIAIPHTRNPVLLHVTRPMLSLCFLEQPVNFSSLDGRPVTMLFTLIAPSLRLHLHLLSKLGFVLRDRALLRLLHAQAGREQIYRALRRAEARMGDRAERRTP